MSSSDALGGGRVGGVYEITTDTLDAGGGGATSVDYGMKMSASSTGGGGAAGTNAANLSGFSGQLYQITGVAFQRDQDARELTSAGQLYGVYQADDLTTGFLSGSVVDWTVMSGPVSSISAAGVMTGGLVGRDTAAVVRGTYAGLSADVSLSVLDVLPDNFGAYASDGITDAWQIEHFGEDNPKAAPLIDADHDGQSNLFEFTAGLLPLDAASRFVLQIEPEPGQPGQMRLVFSPRLAGRAYAVKSSSALAPAVWDDLADFTTSDNGVVRIVTDRAAGGGARFYQVEITKP